MKIHEYQAKEILRKYGVATPRGVPSFSVDEAAKAARELGGKVWVVKAQIHAGGRGKGGGVKVARSESEVRERAGEILGMMLKTHQTGPEGQKVRRLLTGEGRVVALDAKINFDDNAAFRHPEWQQLRDLDEEDPAEVEASKYDLNYIQLDGDIGCLVNGAGLAMATMDIIKLCGGMPANFLDVGGGATTEKVTEAFKIMLRIPHLKAILVNIFGGIMKCDVIAAGVVAAAREVSLRVPLVVRLEGTNADLGKKILAESGLPIISGSNMADAAQKVVAAAGGGSKAAKGKS